MQFENSVSADKKLLPHFDRAVLFPALICAMVCVLLMRSGFLSFLFLVPLGLCTVVYGQTAAWLGLVIAIMGNGVVSMGLSLYWGAGLTHVGLDILYFSAMSLGFTWIMANNPISAIPAVRTVFRFIAASITGALVLWIMIFSINNSEGFYAMLYSPIESILSSYIAELGPDTAAGSTFLQYQMTVDRIIELFSMIFLRGGALVSVFFVLFFSRQITFILARLFRRYNSVQNNPSPSGDLIGFYAPPRTIWVLSLCLPVILLCRKSAPLQPVEIGAWNILVICTIMFLAQGGGIVLFNFTRRPMPFIMRLMCLVLLVFVVLSPGINVLAMMALILLGIAETWLPLRRKGVESRE